MSPSHGVDLAHEIMISAWPKLVDWLESHRVDEHRRQFGSAAALDRTGEVP